MNTGTPGVSCRRAGATITSLLVDERAPVSRRSSDDKAPDLSVRPGSCARANSFRRFPSGSKFPFAAQRDLAAEAGVLEGASRACLRAKRGSVAGGLKVKTFTASQHI